MSILRRNLLLVTCLAALLLLGLGACGASESLVRIRGSSATITKPMLDHWMRTVVGSDFRANVGTKAPEGLVAEPADYPRCIEAAKKVIPRSPTGKLKLSEAQTAIACRHLYQAIKAQALAYLLSVQWTVLEGNEQGVRVSDAELHREFQRYREENFHGSQANEQAYLRERHMTVDDLLYQLKRNLLTRRLQPKFEALVAKAGGGQRTYVRLALAHYSRLIARTTCKPGYVVPGCKGYHEPAVPLPSPSVILEGFAGAVG